MLTGAMDASSAAVKVRGEDILSEDERLWVRLGKWCCLWGWSWVVVGKSLRSRRGRRFLSGSNLLGLCRSGRNNSSPSLFKSAILKAIIHSIFHEIRSINENMLLLLLVHTTHCFVHTLLPLFSSFGDAFIHYWAVFWNLAADIIVSSLVQHEDKLLPWTWKMHTTHICYC